VRHGSNVSKIIVVGKPQRLLKEEEAVLTST
jgi:hypothetical protein